MANNFAVFVCFLFPALGGFLFGYDIGATGFAVHQLTTKHSGVKWGDDVDDSAVLQGAISSGSVFGALLASAFAFRFADVLGRRRELILGSIFYMVGGIIEAVSGDEHWDSTSGITTLLFGRVIYGCGIGFSMHGAPSYIAEMSPPHIRGLLVSCKEALIVFGILMGFVVGYLLKNVDGGWRTTLGLSSAIDLVMCIGSTNMKYR